MKSITIHNIEDSLVSLIQEKANTYGLSINQTVKLLLEKSLGLNPTKKTNNKEEFMDLFGTCPDEDYKEIQERLKEFEEIDTTAETSEIYIDRFERN